ncbi:MAG: ATP-dependent helicase [Oribacterium sp.]
MENLEAMMNERQAEAVRQTEGPLLVLAGAGSGKTRVLTHRVAYLIENRGVAPWHILAITFTNKAAQEMRERVNRLIGARASEIWVSTFHSMCVRILRRNIEALGYTRDFSIYDTEDQKTVMKQIFKDLNIDSKLLRERAVLSVISTAKNSGTDAASFQREAGGSLQERRIADCYLEYEKRLRQNNALDFDDLLLRTLELLRKQEEVRAYYQERFRYILVDEYQDTNDVQFELVHILAERYRNICVVGDDDQSIYSFRGANLENILSFEKSYPGAKVVKLEQNYRSTEKILDTANAVISHNSGRKDKRMWTDRKGGAAVLFQEYETANEEAAAVVREVRDCGRAYSEQAVLYRTNAQSRLLEEQCVKWNVPYRIIGGVNFYQRREIKDVLAYMKLVSNDADDVAFERIINVPKRSVGASSLAKLRSHAAQRQSMSQPFSLFSAAETAEQSGLSGRALKSVQHFTAQIHEWREKLRAAGYLQEDAAPGMEESFSIRELIESIRDDTGYGMELRAEGVVEAETRLLNIEEVISKAADYQASAEQPKLSEFLEEVSLVSDLDRAEEGTDCLTLMTLHGAKGLEFPKVYLVGLSDGLFPGFSSINEPEELEEERRLCYVGITRAEEELVMSSARSRMMNGEYQRLLPSRFVEEMPDSVVRKKLLYVPKPRDDYDGFSAYSGTPFEEENDSRTNSYGFSGMGSLGYRDSGRQGGPHNVQSRAGGRKRSGPGIPSLMQKGMDRPKLEHLDYGVGDRVSHVKFGTGTVTEITQDKRDFMVTVDFDGAGRKKMFASFARLMKL